MKRLLSKFAVPVCFLGLLYFIIAFYGAVRSGDFDIGLVIGFVLICSILSHYNVPFFVKMFNTNKDKKG